VNNAVKRLHLSFEEGDAELKKEVKELKEKLDKKEFCLRDVDNATCFNCEGVDHSTRYCKEPALIR